MDSPAANATGTGAASTAAAPADATEPPVDNWAADHKRKGTVLKKNTRKSAEESRVQTNEQFDRYYRSQLGPLLTADDGEWERMEAVMRTALPVTFRLSGPPGDAKAHALRDEMERTLVAPLRAHASDVLQPPFPLPWYPEQMAWQFDVSRAALRGKSDVSLAHAGPGAQGRSDELRRLHSWLLQETELGRVQRQEAASMVPPLLLEVRPGMSVLDMCASPGSKTQQIIEVLHGAAAPQHAGAPAAAAGADGGGGGGVVVEADGSGLVVANDADNKRCHLLVSRASKLRSPRLVVCNHDARLLPEWLGGEGEGEGGAQGGGGARGVPLRFDRVLCDVPCSGDGTVRKMPAIWRRWSVGGGNALHRLQLQVAARGVRLCRAGGRLVYSTCSLNPIENEAVVAALLRTFGPACLRLVDVSAELPSLVRRPGLPTWRVWYHAAWHSSWDELSGRFPRKCPPFESLFPPSEAEAEAFQLGRCLRLLPHDNDGGGFFVAVFEKLAEHAAEAGALPADEPECCVTEGAAVLPEALTAKAKPPKAGEGAADAPAAKPPDWPCPACGAKVFGSKPECFRCGAPKPAPAAPVAVAAAAADAAAAVVPPEEEAAALGLSVLHAVGGATAERAAAAAAANKFAPLYVPSGALLAGVRDFFGLQPSFPLHRLLARSMGAMSLVLVADEVRALLCADSGGAIRLISTGVRLFDRESAKGVAFPHRVCQNGLPLLLPHMSKQRASLPAAVMTELLRAPQGLPADGWAGGGGGAEQLRQCQPGSVALECGDAPDGRPLAVAVLYAPSGTLRAMITKAERAVLLGRLGQPAGGGGGGADGDAAE